jgi:hypothetical protein
MSHPHLSLILTMVLQAILTVYALAASHYGCYSVKVLN